MRTTDSQISIQYIPTSKSATTSAIPTSSATIEEITPDKASFYLATTVIQRKLSETTVDKYASGMSRGEWKYNGQTIIFDWDGHLINGQHRLRALIKSNTSQTFLVVRGVDSETILTMDDGKRRNFSDNMYMKGSRSAGGLQAAYMFLFMHFSCPTVWGSARLNRPSTTQLNELSLQHPGLADCVNRGNLIAKRTGLLQSSVVVALYLISESNTEIVNAFNDGLITGANLKSGDPRLVLREFAKINTLTGKERQLSHLDAYIFAWNRWVEGRTMGRLSSATHTNRTKRIVPRVIA